ncbi:MAG: lipopolysaccharide heptosyltransferase I [Candidatus Rokuibacteriota bacterium]
MNIALVKLSSLGDVVHALPVAAALRARLPQARLVWIVESREAAVLRGNPALDEVVPVDTRGWRRVRTPVGVAAVAGAVAELRRHLRDCRFDVAVDLQGLIKSGLLTAVTRAPLRIGFAAAQCREPLAAAFTTRRVTPPASARHVVERYLALVEPLGVVAARVEFPLPADAAAESRVDEFFAASGLKARNRLVVVTPGAGRADKRWPAERFGELARRLAAEAAASVLVVWGPSELALAEAVAATSRRGGVVLAPPTDLGELLSVLRRASVVVGGDTGPTHLAAALAVPCVGLYGPTSAERNGPWGQAGRALQSPDGTLESLTVDRVLAAVVDALAS